MTGGRRARTQSLSLPAWPSPTAASHQTPSRRRPAPLSHGQPPRCPPGGLASNNSRRPGADLALYQGRRSRTIWPHSCPGGLTFPAPFQRNPTPRAVPPPVLAVGPPPSTETARRWLSAGLSLLVLRYRPGDAWGRPGTAWGQSTPEHIAFPGLRALGTRVWRSGR